MNFETTKEIEQYKEITLLKMELKQYRVMVKAVDADNLPEGEVIGIQGNDICTGLFESYDEKPTILYNFDHMLTPTHYIEQKDLVRLLK